MHSCLIVVQKLFTDGYEESKKLMRCCSLFSENGLKGVTMRRKEDVE